MQNLEWHQEQTTGIPPLGVCGCGFAVVGRKVVTYGGCSGHDYCWHNSLHELDTSTLQWKELAPNDADGAPLKKCDCGVVAYNGNGEEQLYVLGGFGDSQSASFHKGAEYCSLSENSKYTCTNEFHCFAAGDCTYKK